MKLLFVLGSVILLVAVVFLVFDKFGRKQNFEDVGDMMQYLAGEAVSMASESHGIGLDYSEKSIMDVEKILGNLHEEYPVSGSEKGATGLSMAYGAYIGEVIRRGTPGSKWEQDHPVIGRNSYPLHWVDGEIFPCGWCYKRIINGPEDSVWHKYILSREPRVGEK
jgi:hypothetical protein